jgi:hypoxanthine phosphoribosyltransferase
MTIDEIQKKVEKFIDENLKFFNKIEFVIGVSRGGLIPAVLVATKLDKPLVAAYINKRDEIFFDREEWLKGKTVLIVDDIVRSGKTLNLLVKYLTKTEIKTILIYTVFSVPTLRKYEISVSSEEVKDDVRFPWDHDKV